MSLKEEIQQILLQSFRYDSLTTDEARNKIMSTIENRIDNIKTMNPAGHYNIDLKYLLVEGIKQEILK